MTTPHEDSSGGTARLEGLLPSRLVVIEDRLRVLYAQRMADHQDALGPASYTPLPETPERQGWQIAQYDDEDPLVHLAHEFELSSMEVDLLVCAVLPELNTMCGAAYRMLTGASSRPTVALALELLGVPAADGISQGLLRVTSALFAGGLLAFENPELTCPERVLRVPDRILDYLLGERKGTAAYIYGPHLQELSRGAGPADPAALAALRACLADGSGGAMRRGAVYVQEGSSGLALPAACAALGEVGRTPLVSNPEELEYAPDDFADTVVREARLLRAAVVVPVFSEPDAPEAAVLRRLIKALTRAQLPTVLYGSDAWDSQAWGATPTAFVDLTRVAAAAHLSLPGQRLCTTAVPALDRARRHGVVHARALTPDEAQRISRDCALRDLGRLARRIQPGVQWDDLVLPPPVRERLQTLTYRIRHRQRVLDAWRLRRGGGRGRGATALFAGESGTGKTMAAEAIAAELDVDLYIVNLTTVMSKYIGETEKNLERVFSAAESLGDVLLFDEADSMFAKRGAVRDANDRFANLQSAYLLQRLESFDGLAILTTNLRSNMDGAFTRRFDEVIEFRSPGADVRARLWRTLLGEHADVYDIEHLAARFDLAGGSIRAAVETAAFAAAMENRDVSMKDLLKGVEVEYGKLGRLFNDT
ncbi:ATP-binding protein [Streptomyces kronopolitis]|uniref:ATP-binding protein n=1 Tax=Streptomyces kronopolitis TaxID=1612435 RepID=UPI0020BF7626|nr:ATP-binding protein [Streptomyces kronopolitis]MCL6302595.1 ATP-binding protein [Streptomyces kronopolitis]